MDKANDTRITSTLTLCWLCLSTARQIKRQHLHASMSVGVCRTAYGPVLVSMRLHIFRIYFFMHLCSSVCASGHHAHLLTFKRGILLREAYKNIQRDIGCLCMSHLEQYLTVIIKQDTVWAVSVAWGCMDSNPQSA